ncbi:protein trichome birefringence-like 6 [Phtheirospermum japonicum]|uniref:Protein trichome birefringence-like 6 n=1 Tax=Phtheirospermum japonicum TaxID=374723 RepID=A0A830CP32_9LAMI|nr:protein trichome birefringence-like 6 [Phtheirospermum japonicum]
MLCLLMGGVKDPTRVYEDYKCTVEFYVSHFLVHESKGKIGRKKTPTLRIDTIDKGSSRWRGADILVFNTAHWWSHSKTKAGINYYQEGDRVHPRLDVTRAFQRALSTWASWIDKYINPRKTRIFFRSSSPAHFSGGLWNTGGHCKEAFRPMNETFTSNYPEKNMIVEEIIGQMKNTVTFLNITRLSDYRPDAHPSKYGRKSVNPGVQDCSHWCLPGPQERKSETTVVVTVTDAEKKDSLFLTDEGFNCQSNGRLDKDYMKWRWQPQDCDIPRFNATKMLELIRGKRLVFVGDSINRNQWESMLCLLMGGVKDPKKVYEDYRCTVEFYVTHFLVDESKAKIGKKMAQTLRIDAIDKGSSRWREADILVFNTANWWTHYKAKAGINYYQEGDQVHPRLDVTKAFQRALSTWASWIDKYINPLEVYGIPVGIVKKLFDP